MQAQRPLYFRIIVVALCGMVASMTMQGAHDLTGKWLLAIVLGSCVFVQWMAARWAVEHFMAAATKPGRRFGHLGMGLFGTVLWFLPAVVTVSLLSAELNAIMTANEVGASRFQGEQQRVQKRANAVVANLDAVQSALAGFATHAVAMSKKEEASGSSCMAATSKGPGPVREFRNADSNVATNLNGQVSAPLVALRGELAAVGQMRFGTADVESLRADLQQKVERLNAALAHPMLASVRDAAAQRLKDADRIEFSNAVFKCEDPSRTALLQQVVLAVDSLRQLQPLDNVVLMDPANGRAIATASLLGTWAAISAMLPQRLQVPLNAELARRYDIGQGRLELKPSNLGGFLAWILEFMLIAALVMGTNAGHGGGPGPVGRLFLDKLRGRAPFLGELGDAIFQPASPGATAARPYVDTGVIFPDGSLQDRVRPLLRHYRPYGPVDLLVVPLRDTAAMKAARELELLRLIVRKASALPRGELVSDPRFAAVIDAMAPYEPGPFAVFKIISEDLARHVLAGGAGGRSASA